MWGRPALRGQRRPNNNGRGGSPTAPNQIIQIAELRAHWSGSHARRKEQATTDLQIEGKRRRSKEGAVRGEGTSSGRRLVVNEAERLADNRRVIRSPRGVCHWSASFRKKKTAASWPTPCVMLRDGPPSCPPMPTNDCSPPPTQNCSTAASCSLS